MSLDNGDVPEGLILECVNVPRTVAAVILSGKATLRECQTVYSVADVYLLLEVNAVDVHNKRAIEEWHKSKEG